MNVQLFYFNNAKKVLDSHSHDVICSIINSVNVRIRKGNTRKLRDSIHHGLLLAGWPNKVKISRESQITVTSIKNSTGLCLQFGNVARMYADILKLQKLYLDGVIKDAIMIVPAKPVAKMLGSNMVNSIRLENELRVFNKVINVPVTLFEIS